MTGIQQKKLARYLANQYPVNPNQNLIYFNQTLLLPLSFSKQDRKGGTKRYRGRERETYDR